jgi:hypothetical protein
MASSENVEETTGFGCVVQNDYRAVLGDEPRTSRTLSENHTTRPNSHLKSGSRRVFDDSVWAMSVQSPSCSPPPPTSVLACRPSPPTSVLDQCYLRKETIGNQPGKNRIRKYLASDLSPHHVQRCSLI